MTCKMRSARELVNIYKASHLFLEAKTISNLSLFFFLFRFYFFLYKGITGKKNAVKSVTCSAL